MNTVHIGIASAKNTKARARPAFKGVRQGEHISFASIELMHRVLNPNRWNVLRAMMGQGEIGIRELARMLDRDVKAVHTDVTVLLDAGVIDRTEGGTVIFPYDAARVDFLVE